jgi:hypothetical protein
MLPRKSTALREVSLIVVEIKKRGFCPRFFC